MPILNQMVKSPPIDITLSALADPTRRHILELLATGPATITELARPLDISLPGVLKHVRILEEARLVDTIKNGRTRECRLGPAKLDDVSEWVDRYRRRWEARLDRLETYLAEGRGGRR